MVAFVINTIFMSSQPVPLSDLGTNRYHLFEVPIRRRLAVATESDVVEPSQSLGERD